MTGYDDEGNYVYETNCKRCYVGYDLVNGEIPLHACIDGWYTSESYITQDGYQNLYMPKFVRRYKKGEDPYE